MVELLEMCADVFDPQQIIGLGEGGFQNLNFFHVYRKDKFGKYLAGNHQFIKAIGLNKINELFNLTDFDFLSKKEAFHLRQNDQYVIHTKKQEIFVEPVTLSNGKKMFAISHKAPFVNARKIVGIMGYSFIVERKKITSINKIESLKNMKLDFDHNPKSYHSSAEKTCFTKRQMNCLYYLLRGMTAKQIAKELNLSYRTIEGYLQMMKNRLNCSSRYELIDKTLKLGLFHRDFSDDDC